MDEQILFDRFHEALDTEPPAGAYARLQIALVKSPVKLQPRLALQPRWSRTGLRLSAVLTAIVLAIVAVAAFLATHRALDGSVPAGSDRAIKSYQTLVGNDYQRSREARPRGTCMNFLDASCPAATVRSVSALQQWLDDLNQSEPPARFAFVDAQMRSHLGLLISDMNAAAAAQRAKDQSGLAHANQAAGNERGWLDDTVSSVVNSQQGTVATYTEAVRLRKQNLVQCAGCEQLVSQRYVSCNGDQASACQDGIQHISFQVVRFEAATIRVAAPNSLMTKDIRLQSDLAKADTALIAMTSALSVGDQAAFDAGRISLQRALAAVDQDATDILNG
jgi:hypothetical protein